MNTEDMSGFGEQSVEHLTPSPLDRLFGFAQNALGFTEDRQMQHARQQLCTIELVDEKTQDQFRTGMIEYQSSPQNQLTILQISKNVPALR